MNNAPIGIFDSGIGGLTIWKEIIHLLPKESTLYLGDGKNAPYGIKSENELIHLSKKNTDFLLNQGAKLIVVACNTATTVAIEELRKTYSVPFIGVEPAFKPAALQSQSKKVGVLATKGTLNSTLFHETYSRFGKDVETVIQVGTGLVELIEQGRIDSAEMHSLLTSYLEPMIELGVDCIVLGCTHYPLLKYKIDELMPYPVELIDSGAAVAGRTKKVLEEANLIAEHSPVTRQFFTTSNSGSMQRWLDHWFAPKTYEATYLNQEA